MPSAEGTMHRNIQNRYITSMLIVFIMSVAATKCFADTTTLYRETYNFCTETLGKDAASEANWVGVVSGLAPEKLSNLKVVSYGVEDIGGSVNSLPVGLSQGYAFWFRPVEGLAVFTGEFQFDVGLLRAGDTSMRYLQRLSGVDSEGLANQTHVAILVDDMWYISREFARQTVPGVWESVEFSPANLAYGMVPYREAQGPVLPDSFSSPLPASGTVRAFGVFVPEVNGRVRLDNFEIVGPEPTDGSIGTEVQEPNVSLCPEGSPDHQGDSGLQPPEDDDSDTNPDQEEPDDTTGGGDGSLLSYEFCPLKQQGRGRYVSINRAQRGRLLRSIGDASLVDLRDRVLVRLYGRKRMRMGSLVNMKVGDYDPASKVLMLSVRPNTKPQRVRIGRLAAKALEEYLFFPGAPTEKHAPLFIQEGIQTAYSNSVKTFCKPDIRQMLKARAASVRLRIDDIISR